MKKRYQLLLKSYNILGIISFILNSLQSVLSDFLFGLCYFFLFDYKKINRYYFIGMMIFILFIFIYFIFLIPLWGYLMEKCEFNYKVKLKEFAINEKLNSKMTSHSSEFILLLQYDINNISSIAGWNLVVFFQAIISGVVSSIIIGIISKKILIYLYFIGLISIIIDFFYTKYVSKLILKNREKIEKKIAMIVDFINNITIIKIYNQDKYIVNEIRNNSNEIIKNNMSINKLENRLNLINNLIYTFILKITVTLIGINHIMAKEMTFGKLMFVYSMVNGIVFILEYMGKYIKNLEKIKISNKKFDNFFKKIKDKNIKKRKIVFKNINEIHLKNITCSKNGEKIFKNYNKIFSFNKDYIILGENGRGKTTLLKILLGYEEIEEGEIWIDGKKIDKKNKNEIYFSFVLQDPLIYNESILENLILDNKNISIKNIMKVIEIVELKEFINNLEEGLNTVIKENGKNISKGEKMRIAIARELLKNNNVILLDEPDANLDKKTTEKIISNIKRNYKNTSLIVVTHLSKRKFYKNFEKIYL